MTEQEAIRELEWAKIRLSQNNHVDNNRTNAFNIAFKALEEIQQYRATGTVEEVIELKKQNIALRNRCRILTNGQLCIFCPMKCEERTDKFRNMKGDEIE